MITLLLIVIISSTLSLDGLTVNTLITFFNNHPFVLCFFITELLASANKMALAYYKAGTKNP